jgi:hypothetical protein
MIASSSSSPSATPSASASSGTTSLYSWDVETAKDQIPVEKSVHRVDAAREGSRRRA